MVVKRIKHFGSNSFVNSLSCMNKQKWPKQIFKCTPIQNGTSSCRKQSWKANHGRLRNQKTKC